VTSQQTGWAARQSAERMRQRSGTANAGSTGGGSLQQDQHAGSQESATGPPASVRPTTRGPSFRGRASWTSRYCPSTARGWR
jgi:hypothetical protein